MVDCAHQWTEIVKNIGFFASVCDASRDASGSGGIASFSCMLCSRCYATHQAMLTHARVKHGARTDRRLYADDDGVCKACRKQFSTRLRLISHWSNPHRTACWLWVVANTSPMDTDKVAQLDAADALACRSARKHGHTRPLTAGPVKQAPGGA